MTSGAKQFPLYHERDDEPLLIIGRDHSRKLLQKLFLDDVHENRAAAFFGDSRSILPHIPPERVKDTILFNLHFAYPRTFNPLARVPEEERSIIAEGFVEAFAAAYETDVPTPRLDNNLYAAALAMLSVPDGTMYKARHLFTSEPYRTEVIGQIKDNDLADLWRHYDGLEERERHQIAESVLNRFLPLTTDPWYRNIIGQKDTLPLSDKTILLVDLPKGRKATLLAALIMTRLTGRVYIERPLVFVGRGNPVVACRYLSELPEKWRDELLATASLMAFRLGVKDRKTLEPDFNLKPQDFNLSDLQAHHAYVRQEDTHLVRVPQHGYPVYPKSPKAIRNRARSDYSSARAHVEAKITTFIQQYSS